MPTSALVLRSAFLSLLLSFTASAGQAQKPATEKPAVETPATKAESSAPALSEVDAAVLAAAQQGDAAALAAALAAGGDLEAADPDGATPLLWAAGNGHLDAVRVLTEAGAALEGGTGIVWLNRDTGLYMSSPLVAAAAFGHLAVVQHLAEQGADLDQPGWDPAAEAFVGWTALQWAAALGHTPVVAYLAAQGADLELGFGVPTPPLALALQAGHTETAAALEAAGASQVRAEAHLPVAMGPDAATTGALTDVHPLNQDGSHFVTHTLDLATAVPFTVAVTSDAFDPMLVAVSPSGVASSNDDWLGDPTEARVVVEAGEAGGWQVLVWSYEAAQTGAFTVTHQTLTEAEARALQTQAADLARADSLGQAAVALAGDGRTAEAVVLAEEEVALRGDVQGGEHPGMATSLHNLAAIYADLQRYDEAEARYEQALSLYETHLGPDHPEVAGTLGNLGDLYHTTGRYTEAVPLLQRALAIAEMTAQGDSSDLAALDVARALG
ncbi:MAG: tetratricopeptide repeat protein, partial [Bacteroidota bacterium]